MPAIIAAVIMAAGSAYAASEASSSAEEGMRGQTESARRTAEMQRKLYEKGEATAEPFRQALYPQLLDIIKSGGTDTSKLTNNPMYGAMRSPLEDQYARARESLGATQGGGALMRALSQLEGQRAESVGRIPGQLYETARQEGMNLAGINLQAGPQSLASAGGAYQNLAGMYGQQMNQANQQLGQAGSALGQALYGQYLKGGSGTPQSYGNTGGANYWSGQGNTLAQTDQYWGY